LIVAVLGGLLAVFLSKPVSAQILEILNSPGNSFCVFVLKFVGACHAFLLEQTTKIVAAFEKPRIAFGEISTFSIDFLPHAWRQWAALRQLTLIHNSVKLTGIGAGGWLIGQLGIVQSAPVSIARQVVGIRSVDSLVRLPPPPRCCPLSILARHQVRSVLPDQNLFERQIGKEVLPVSQLRDLLFPAAPSQGLLSSAPAVLVAALHSGVGHHPEAHAFILKLAHEVTRVVHQQMQIEGPTVLLVVHGLVHAAKLAALLAKPVKSVDLLNLGRITLRHDFHHFGPLRP
jgi:hypothetical protein